MDEQGADKRREVRYQIKGGIEGYFDLLNNNANIKFQVLNVSKSGMCIITPHRLPDDHELTLVIKQLVAKVSVAWMIPIEIDSEIQDYKYGLCNVAEEIDFVAVLQEMGLLSENVMRTTTTDSEAFVDEFFLATDAK